MHDSERADLQEPTAAQRRTATLTSSKLGDIANSDSKIPVNHTVAFSCHDVMWPSPTRLYISRNRESERSGLKSGKYCV